MQEDALDAAKTLFLSGGSKDALNTSSSGIKEGALDAVKTLLGSGGSKENLNNTNSADTGDRDTDENKDELAAISEEVSAPGDVNTNNTAMTPAVEAAS